MTSSVGMYTTCMSSEKNDSFDTAGETDAQHNNAEWTFSTGKKPFFFLIEPNFSHTYKDILHI